MGWPHACGRALALAALAGVVCSSEAGAQAWVPDKGDGTFAISTQYTRVLKHLFSVDVSGIVDANTGYLLGPGNRGYFGDIVTFTQTLSAEYVPLKRLAVTGEVTLTTSRYRGASPEGALDDGAFHGDLQDMQIGARYQLPIRAFALTPSLDMRFPITDYSTGGHVGAGTGLTSFTLGLNSGRSLDPLLPMGYVFVNGSHAFVEDVAQNSLDRDQFSVGTGVFLSSALSLQGHFSFAQTTDGTDWWWSGASHLQHRDVAAKTVYRRLGASAGYSITHRVGIALSWESTISGANVHAAHSLTLGASWGFWDPRRFAGWPHAETGSHKQ